MTLPSYYNPEEIGTLRRADIDTAARAGRAASLAPAENDGERIYLLLIDMQVDFVHGDGALSVPNAPADARRLIEWMYANMGKLTRIGLTLDSHLPLQIFHPPWWVDANGEHPQPMTPISSDEVKSGKWTPLYEVEWSKQYVELLEEQSKKQLMIWPFHVLLGTPGHTLTPALSEAVTYHAAARQAQPQYYIKGLIPKSEHYSAFEPEVEVPEDPRGTLDTDLLDEIANYDRIYVAGQAKSHCVLESLASMMRYYSPDVARKVHLLEDTTSPVAHPEIDFDAIANEALARFQSHGLQRTTTDAVTL